jgi:hypothetical protein
MQADGDTQERGQAGRQIIADELADLHPYDETRELGQCLVRNLITIRRI